MSASSWRTLCFALAALCAVLLWRDCTASPSEPPPAPDCPRVAPPVHVARAAAAAAAAPSDREPPAAPPEADDDGPMLYGIKLPAWLVWIAPHPGEDLRGYRDRMLPLAVAALAPQRARVARSLDSFAALAHLDPHQRGELDAATRDTAAALQDRILNAVLGGELAPATFKPMAGVGVARELLDIVDRGNRRFLDTLGTDQRAALAQHPFDFGDYLVFSTRWEDALRLL
ncbi:MAG TPA: hypothetical protein VHW23_23950 [Kofleriaceae bacterium]|jgi:hypothetical protein|nr:hypothetical protein [Kofleriaceae bacterium]